MLTINQEKAVKDEGNNIIVSAGAGSGKTTVLSERVIRKVRDNIHVDRLLILTFTNAAAKEMKDRIRKNLSDNGLNEDVDLIDNSYITTFDSFSLSIVKKYHTYLNISHEIGITDSALLSITKQEIMEEIFNEYYTKQTPKFENLIHNFCFKDDKELKALLIKLSDKLDLKNDKSAFLDNYLTNYFNLEKIDSDIELYYKEIEKNILEIKKLIKKLSLYTDGTYIEKVNMKLENLFNSTNYDEVVNNLDFSLPNLPRNSDDDTKEIKEEIAKIIKQIKLLASFESAKEIKEEILATKENIEIIIEIEKEFDDRFTNYKYKNNMFDFSDISRMAIKLVEENKDIRDELTNKFQEIMVDEYQDTSDLQEYFISLISKNNVYMVGDVKQSIYRFRNANPDIFKDKYNLYKDTDKGIKIDLLENFRSRDEVLSNINTLFDKLMDLNYGGADYKESHRMVFGNKTYINEGKTNQEYNLEILTYKEDKEFTNNEKEMFIIGNDIIDKVKNKFQVFDMKKKLLRDIKYSDFVILIDRATDFDNYKKVFEYLHIPLNLYKDEDLKSADDILIIKNLLKLIRCIDKENYKDEFKYCFTSLARSYLFRLSDEELFEYFYNDSFKESIIYKKLVEAYNYYYELSPKMFFLKLIDIFDIEEKILTTSNIKIGRVRLEYFYNLIDNFSSSGKDIEDFISYLDNVFDMSMKLTFSINDDGSNSVKIMTIHKSKGLEFPICYFSGFSKEFSFKELNDKIIFNNKYGIVIPYFNEYEKNTIYKTLLKINNKDEEISEKIRLLYVALTRAKEKMIMVMPDLSEKKKIYNRNMVKSFLDMMKYIEEDIECFRKNVDIKCSKDYKTSIGSISKIESGNKLNIEELSFDTESITNEKFSKGGVKLITKEEQEKMNYGTKVHEVLELIDFKKTNYDLIDDSFVKNKVKIFIESDLIKNNINSKFYKEYEFTYLEDDILKHGIIDLMIENDKEIIIVDYKLKNVLDDAYKKQLNGYKTAIEKLSDKDIKIYLYSIIDSKLVSI